MKKNPNELTIENSALVLIDHQPAILLLTPSIDQALLINNVAGLARTAKVLGVPVVLTTVGAKGSVLADPILKEISEVFPEITPIDRTSTHAWSHPEVRAAVEATGRKKLIMAGISTEVCLAQSVLAALKDGYEVYFVSDCSAGCSREAHEDAKVRMTMAGARPMSWLAVQSEWAPDYTTPEKIATAEVLSRYGGASAMWVDYTAAQVKAGLVQPPAFMRHAHDESEKERPSDARKPSRPDHAPHEPRRPWPGAEALRVFGSLRLAWRCRRHGIASPFGNRDSDVPVRRRDPLRRFKRRFRRRARRGSGMVQSGPRCV